MGGEWLPLSVWAERGFEADKIKDNATAEDMKFSEKNKWWNYRVVLDTDMVVYGRKPQTVWRLVRSAAPEP